MVQKHRALARGVGLSRAASPGFVAALALLLGGCPSPWTRPEPQGNAPAVPQPAEPAPPPAPACPRRRRGRRSRRARITSRPPPARWSRRRTRCSAHGDIDGASATLDRALRIEPSNPLLWIELGRVRLVDGNAHQAEVCARKALALASGDPAAQGQAGRVLVDALRAQGRNQEARRSRAGRTCTD